MFISRGWGVLALLLPIAAILVGITLYGENGNASLPILACSLIASGILMIVLGLILNKKSAKKHDMYFLALPIWGILWIVAGGIAAAYAYL